MNFVPTPIDGAWIVELELLRDERGFFARSFCAREFAERGLSPCVAQANVSRSERRGTLRGMHRQLAPHAEAKLVRCTHGAIWDAIVDLRAGSPTFRRWFGLELRAEAYRLLYVPEDVAHGFVTLTDGAEVTYQLSAAYAPAAAHGVRWNDPAFGIEWPVPVELISDRDAAWPDFAR